MTRRLLAFTALTFAVSWASWLAIIDQLGPNPFASTPLVMALFLLGAYSPSLVGVILTGVYDGKAGLKALLKRTLAFRVGGLWFLAALLVGPILYAAAAAVYVALGGSVGEVNYGLLPWIPVVFIVPIVFGPLAEEFGWRGFALPLLDHKRKPIVASVIIGFIWALWHAPLFWAETGTSISGYTIDAYTIALFFAAVIGSSFIYTWMFNGTAGSLFIAVLLHLSMNASGTITGMLFPEMTLEQKFDLYECYVVALWAILLIGTVVRRLVSSRAAAPAPATQV
jgi:membrane protease YdiL (CAAX protease family)